MARARSSRKFSAYWIGDWPVTSRKLRMRWDFFIPVSAQKGDDLPVSTFVGYEDGTMPMGTTAYEKRGIATQIPVWDPQQCLQCNRCSYVCPHAVLRPYLLDEAEAAAAPAARIAAQPTHSAAASALRQRNAPAATAETAPASPKAPWPAVLTLQARAEPAGDGSFTLTLEAWQDGAGPGPDSAAQTSVKGRQIWPL